MTRPTPPKTENQHTETRAQAALKLAAGGLFYVLFHLRLGRTFGEGAAATIAQMLLTLPYAAGFTLVLLLAYRRLAGGDAPFKPDWTRVLRIFFTLGICFALFFALYEYGGGDPYDPSSGGGFWGDVFRKMRSR